MKRLVESITRNAYPEVSNCLKLSLTLILSSCTPYFSRFFTEGEAVAFEFCLSFTSHGLSARCSFSTLAKATFGFFWLSLAEFCSGSLFGCSILRLGRLFEVVGSGSGVAGVG